MFKEIVSQLSLSPSAMSQLAFYARRLKQERITRTFSAIAAVLVVGLQFSIIAAPPAPSNAASPGDIIHGGIVSRDDLLNQYDKSSELRALYTYMGITRSDLAATKTTNVNSKDHTLNSLSRVAHESGEGSMTVGSNTYYYRPLFHADTGSFKTTGSSYKVLQGTSSRDHREFAVMFLCGNIIFHNTPPAPTPTPKPTPKPTVKPTPTPTPVPTKTLVCGYLTGDTHEGDFPLPVNFTGTGVVTNQTITEYQFTFGDGAAANQAGATVAHTYIKPGTYTASLKVKGSSGKVSAPAAACTYTVTVTAPPVSFTKNKSAMNVTQSIDATTKPARGGDVITYTLTTKNTGKSAQDYSVVEHIEDVLEYADVTVPNGAVQTTGVLTWPAVTIQPGATLTKTFTVKVKNPIPDTPVGTSDKFSYDLRMDNVYGNSVQVTLEPTFAKQVEGASTELPQTGSGSTSVIVMIFAILALFFYFRNRQLVTEVRILRNEYHGGVQ
jgi:LPXTG-motif cell wall-anchored protein